MRFSKVTQLEKHIMRIQEIANHSQFKFDPLVEYNGKVKLVFQQQNGQLHFIINYQFYEKKIISDIDFYFTNEKNTYINIQLMIILIQIILKIFEDGEHQAINCNMKLTTVQSYESCTLLQQKEIDIWNKLWDKLGYESYNKIMEFQSIQQEVYSSNCLTLWKKDRNLSGDLFYFFYLETTIHSFHPVSIHQVQFQDNSIEIHYFVNEIERNLNIEVDKNFISVREPKIESELTKLFSIMEFKLWLQQYLNHQSINITSSQKTSETKNIKILLQRCIGEVPHEKLEFFAQNCLTYLQNKFPSENIEQYIQDNLETIEIFHLNERIVAVTIYHYLLCISKSTNLSWMSQMNLEFNLIENK